MSYAQSWQDFEKNSGGRTVLQGSPENIKKQYEDLVAVLMPHAPPFPENVDFEEKDVEGVKVRIYNPKGASGSLPIGIWTHGGVSHESKLR